MNFLCTVLSIALLAQDGVGAFNVSPSSSYSRKLTATSNLLQSSKKVTTSLSSSSSSQPDSSTVIESTSLVTPDETTTTPNNTPLGEEEKEKEADMNVPVLERLSNSFVTSVKTNDQVNLSTYLQSANDKSMVIFGTYAADFNAIEYVQRLRYYLPQLQAKGIDKIGLILNCDADAAKTLVSMLGLDTDATSSATIATATSSESSPVVELFVDPLGEAGRKFGVGRGWRSDDDEMSPYVKLFGMLWGLGAWATLPAVIGGYIGNPFFGQPWIEDALAVGQRKGRWPDNALDISEESGEVVENKFKALPVVGQWERRPLELATLRLQNMVDVSIKNWEDLSPKEDALKAGVLTQLGGCVVVDSKSGDEVVRWRDPGICAVANFENLLERIE